MLIEMRAVPPFHKNGFVVGCDRTRTAILIDPGDEVDDLLAIVASQKLSVKYTLLTHAHIDHVTGVAKAKRAVGAPVYLHRSDKILYDALPQQAAMFGLAVPEPAAVDMFYDMETPLAFGDLEVNVHHTPGHCPGGVCLQIGSAGRAGRDLFVGDTLFAGSIGRSDLPGGDHQTLIHSITQVLFALGDDATVYPATARQPRLGRNAGLIRF